MPSEIIALRDTITRLLYERDEARAEVAGLKRALERALEMRADRDAEIDALKAEIVEIWSIYARNHAVSVIAAERDAALAEIAELRGQIEAYREEDAEWNEGWTRLEAERDAARAELQASHRAALLGRLAELKAERDAAREEVQASHRAALRGIGELKAERDAALAALEDGGGWRTKLVEALGKLLAAQEVNAQLEAARDAALAALEDMKGRALDASSEAAAMAVEYNRLGRLHNEEVAAALAALGESREPTALPARAQALVEIVDLARRVIREGRWFLVPLRDALAAYDGVPARPLPGDDPVE